jgi:hypothetical protein
MEHACPVLTTTPFHGRAPAALSKSGKPGPPMSGCPENCFLKAWKGPVLPTMLDHRRVPTSPLKSKKARFPTAGRKAGAFTLWATKEGLLPQGAQRPSTSQCTCLQETTISPVQEQESQQQSTLKVLEGLPPTVHRDPALPTVTALESRLPYQRAETHWKKEQGNLHHKRTLQWVTFPAYPSLRKTTRMLGEKAQNPNQLREKAQNPNHFPKTTDE